MKNNKANGTKTYQQTILDARDAMKAEGLSLKPQWIANRCGYQTYLVERVLAGNPEPVCGCEVCKKA